MYESLANDFQYPHPEKLVIFPDNHDMSRFYTQLGENADLVKLGIAYYATMRGIPQLFYGTEILMFNRGPKDDGIIRTDFPGGWDGDSVNAFTGVGLTDQQKDIQDFCRKVLNWRTSSEAVHTGELKHFIPEADIYVYFRYSKDEKVMVILNKNNQDKTIDTDRFNEVMSNCTSGEDIISGKKISDLKKIDVPASSAMIIELK
jgi:glycosidase